MTDALTAAPDVQDARTMAMLRNDLRGLTKEAIGQLVAELTRRMGVDPAMAPIDLIPDRGGALRLYINARGAAELAKRQDLTDDALDVDIRDKVVIVKVAKTSPFRPASQREPEHPARTLRDVGAAAFDPDNPSTLARAIKAATTSAHRRATLRMVGVFLNEPENWDAVTDA